MFSCFLPLTCIEKSALAFERQLSELFISFESCPRNRGKRTQRIHPWPKDTAWLKRGENLVLKRLYEASGGGVNNGKISVNGIF